jgi:beta-glucosidase
MKQIAAFVALAIFAVPAPAAPTPDALLAEVLAALTPAQRAAVQGEVKDGRVVLTVQRPQPEAFVADLGHAVASKAPASSTDCVDSADKSRGTTACKIYAGTVPPPAPLPGSKPASRDPRALIAAMTEDEKLDLLSGTGFDTKPIPRLGIPALKMADGPIGFRGGTVTGPATAFPAAVAMAATFDADLNRRVAGAQADEAKARGVRMILGPDVNIQRLPLGGRSFEMFSEDPYLTSRLAVEYVRGVQERGVIATVKHFLLNDQEIQRTVKSSDADERTIHEIYGAPFAATAREALAVMGSYNPVNGIYGTENKKLLVDYLRGELGFNGLVVSDWFAMRSGVGAAEGGTDLEMPSELFFGQPLREAVRNGLVPLSRIEDMDYAILNAMKKIGLLDEPQRPVPAYPKKSPGESVKLALDAAEESIVLLKNDRDPRGDGSLLPLSANRLHRLAVIGPNAAVYRHGGGSSTVTPFSSVTPLDGLRRRLGSSVELLYAPGVNIPHDFIRGTAPKDAAAGIREAARAAAESDAAVVFVGDVESEDADRPGMGLPGRQDELIAAVAKANPRTVVVLLTGSPVSMPWLDQVRSVLVAWYPGQQEGQAIARVLFGEVNPSGKLPVAFPARFADSPAAKSYPGGASIKYTDGIYVGQRGLDKAGIKALFPFGHGLSYTRFGYSTLDVHVDSPDARDPKVSVSVEITNAGGRAGTEVAQLYVGQDAPSADRPFKELKGFERITVAPGQTKTATFLLDRSAFAYWHPVKRQWVVEPGRFHVYVGSSSQDIRAAAALELK